LASIVDHARDAILAKQLDGTIVQWNGGCEALYGFTAEEAIGRNILALVVPEDRREELGPRWEMVAGGTPVPIFETVRRTKEGGRIEVELAISPVFDEEGAVVAASAIARDITERKRLERDLERANAELNGLLVDQAPALDRSLQALMVENLREGCQIISRDYRYLYLNDAALSHSHGQKDRGELIGRTMMESYPGIEDTAMFEKLEECMEERKSGQYENEFRLSNGDTGWFDLRMTPVPSGLAILSVKITEYKQALLELQRSNKELDEYARTVSHDIQGPLRRLVTFSELLEGDLGDVELPTRAREDLDAIVHSTRLLQELVSNELELAQVTQHSVALAGVDVDGAIDTALARLREPIREQAPRLVRDSMPRVKADRELLVRIYHNLISNALKYRSDDRHLEIRFTVSQSERGCILGLQDNGIGIEAQYLQLIFQPLKRLHGPELSGRGIGLALCQRAIERMGGRIWAESPGPDQGSHFRFEVRAYRGEPEEKSS